MIDGHKTSVSLEDAFWRGLKEIARGQQATLSNVVAEIDKARQRGNLSSAIRLFVLDRVRAPSTTGPAMLSLRETEKAASPDGLLRISAHVSLVLFLPAPIPGKYDGTASEQAW